jgi:Zn-dependent M28 family amino/carboxypeptidase
VIGVIPGKQPGEIVIGAHFDSWFAGSTDNGGGVAALLALAERRAKRPQPAYTLVFVGYDGEEVALYGGYQFLRRHRIVAQEPILAVLNFEVPSANGSSLLGLARSNIDPLDQALRSADLNDTYVLYAAMDYVPILFGGIIPTDIQGIYRNGVPTASTAVDTPYYHTTQDTPDKVDTMFLAGAIDQFDQAIEALDADQADGFAASDPKLWKATVQPRARAAGQDLVVDVAVTDAGGAPQAMAAVRAALTVDDFFLAAHAAATTDGAGKATVTLPAGAAEAGQGDRWLHVTAGPDFPLVEELVPLP